MLSLFDDMPDDPNVLRLRSLYALTLVFQRQYDEARVEADRTLAAAERLSLGEIAARMLRVKGMIAQFQGRMWEAIALLEGARRVAEQLGLAVEVEAANTSLALVLALDDPRAAAVVERLSIEQARRAGHRGRETVNLGNVAEDLRRTGDWDWVLSELERATRDEDRNVTDLFLDVARSGLLAYRGALTEADVAELEARVRVLADDDMEASIYDVKGTVALVEGRFGDAARFWIAFADGSDLNAPYALPKAGTAAVLAGDATLAQEILARLGKLGSRGRAIETDMAVIRAGIQAISGDHDAAKAGFRVAWTRFGDLGLVYDQALQALIAAAVLGADDPEVAGWLGEARAIFERLRATPLLALLDRHTASVWTRAASGDSPAQ